jgi:hypothetical protein
VKHALDGGTAPCGGVPVTSIPPWASSPSRNKPFAEEA